MALELFFNILDFSIPLAIGIATTYYLKAIRDELVAASVIARAGKASVLASSSLQRFSVYHFSASRRGARMTFEHKETLRHVGKDDIAEAQQRGVKHSVCLPARSLAESKTNYKKPKKNL